MINYDNVTKENTNKHNRSWTEIADNPCRIFIIGCPGSGKANKLLNLIKQKDEDDYSIIDKTYLMIQMK